MEIDRKTDATLEPAGPDYFTGSVAMRRLQAGAPPARTVVLEVTFQPGARTNWHTHPFGQTLVVTEGSGWVQTEGEPRQTIGPGDTIRFAPDERHWHGATETSAMTHVAIQERDDAGTATWAEPVSDEDYLGA